MNAGAAARRPSTTVVASGLTHVELTWVDKRIEHWIRFGRIAEEKILDRRRRIVSFAPGGVFAFVRWASNDFGTIISRIDIVRAVAPGESYATLPFVRPGGDILLRINGWPKVDQVLQAIDVGGSLRRRSRRRSAGPLAARPQSPDGWRTAPPLHACAPQGLAHAPQCRAMIGRGAILAVMALGVGATALPQLDDRPPWLVWNASASVPIGLYAVARIIEVHAGDLVVVETARTPCPVPCRWRLSAARRAVAETRGGACRTNGLPHRPQRHCRRNRNGRCPRARWPRPRASCLGGLPRHRPGRSFPDEPAVRRLARRTLFRPAPRRLDRRPRDPSLGQSNRRGGVIVPPSRESVAVTPCDNGAAIPSSQPDLARRFCRPSRLVGSQSSALCYRPRATRVRQRARRPSIW